MLVRSGRARSRMPGNPELVLERLDVVKAWLYTVSSLRSSFRIRFLWVSRPGRERIVRGLTAQVSKLVS